MSVERDRKSSIHKLERRLPIVLSYPPSVDPLTTARIREVPTGARAWLELLSERSKPDTSTDK